MIRLALLLVALVTGCCSEPSAPPSASGGVPGAAAPEAWAPKASGVVEREVEAAIAAIDSMRSARAASIAPDETLDAETFARVCQPVGARIRALADSTGWTVRQVASRYRNPGNRPTAADADLLPPFEADPTLTDTWTDTPQGRLYTRRITVEPGCLACHGPREDRPAFIAERYPEDRAYGFQPGDLRGVYTVRVQSEP